MDSTLGRAYIKGIYRDGSIHADGFSIRVYCPQPFPEEELLFIGDIYLDSLDRPYIFIDKESTKLKEYYDINSFINILMHPTKEDQLQVIELHDGQRIWVDFRDVQERCVGYYHCTLEFRDGIWYFVPKGVDRVD